MPNHTSDHGKVLVVRYQPPSSQSVPIGLALYLPSASSIYFRFRDEPQLFDPNDYEVLADIGGDLQAIASDLGAKAAFEWMESSLSNVVFVEGPVDVELHDGADKVLSNLYERYCGRKAAAR